MTEEIMISTKNVQSSIRQKEDDLFTDWVISRPERFPFATDGCADPDAFLAARYRIVFALKERNWGHTVNEQREYASSNLPESDRISQMQGCNEREIFNDWWTGMAQWAEVLLASSDVNWQEIQGSFFRSEAQNSAPSEKNERDQFIQERNRAALGRCACIQLKKAPGGSKMNKDDFGIVVSQDRPFILRQLAIYSPHFIISCGSGDNWNVFRHILFPKTEIQYTRNGIQYMLVSDIEAGLHKTAVVNFGHPSMRINGNLWGVLTLGLRDSLDEIMALHQDLGGALI